MLALGEEGGEELCDVSVAHGRVGPEGLEELAAEGMDSIGHRVVNPRRTGLLGASVEVLRPEALRHVLSGDLAQRRHGIPPIHASLHKPRQMVYAEGRILEL